MTLLADLNRVEHYKVHSVCQWANRAKTTWKSLNWQTSSGFEPDQQIHSFILNKKATQKHSQYQHS